MKPVIKWAGGKGFLVDTVKDMQPKGYKRYYEPFAGGAAVLLGLQPTAATLNDINPELTNVYIQIKSNPAAVIEELTELDNRHQTAANPRDFYYAVRARFNLCMGTNTPAQAARLIYLNKHCFNGLYRVNASGDFNVPFNGKVSGNSFTASNINEVSNYLKNVTITTADFEQSLPYIEKEDFVFIDSPYVPTTANSFTGYTMTGFSQNDHLRLHDYCKQLTNKGAYFLMTNSDTSFVRSYYGGYNIKAIDTARRINRNGDGRKGVDLLITNY